MYGHLWKNNDFKPVLTVHNCDVRTFNVGVLCDICTFACKKKVWFFWGFFFEDQLVSRYKTKNNKGEAAPKDIPEM